MSRPSRIELLEKFFPEIKDKATAGEREASIRLNSMACELILADLITKYDNALAKQGKGILILYLNRGKQGAAYVSAADFEQDLETAKTTGDSEMEDFLASALQQIEAISPDKAALVMLVDNTGAQVFPIDRDYPANPVKAMLEEFSA
jgi:hypothetical protein